MFLIAHRGNVNGIQQDKENEPGYLQAALKSGFNVEVDIWLTADGFFFGHDGPQYKVDESIFTLLDPARTWYHAKNAQALDYLKQKPNLHCFWHQEDDYTLTSKGFIWVHCDNAVLLKDSICVLPEVRKNNDRLKGCAGICSDFIEKYK